MIDFYFRPKNYLHEGGFKRIYSTQVSMELFFRILSSRFFAKFYRCYTISGCAQLEFNCSQTFYNMIRRGEL